MQHGQNPYWREPFTVGHLLSLLDDSESLRAENRKLSEQGLLVGSAEDATFLDNCAHLRWIDAALAYAPGYDRLKPHFAALGERPTATALRKLVGRVCIGKGLEWREVSELTLDEFADLLEAGAVGDEGPQDEQDDKKADAGSDSPGYAPLSEIVRRLGIPDRHHDAARKRLERAAYNDDDLQREVTNRRKNEPRFLYHVEKARTILSDLIP